MDINLKFLLKFQQMIFQGLIQHNSRDKSFLRRFESTLVFLSFFFYLDMDQKTKISYSQISKIAHRVKMTRIFKN